MNLPNGMPVAKGWQELYDRCYDEITVEDSIMISLLEELSKKEIKLKAYEDLHGESEKQINARLNGIDVTVTYAAPKDRILIHPNLVYAFQKDEGKDA
jgi:UDP-glucose 6-dehydrogenase